MATHYRTVTHQYTATPRIVTSREKTSSPVRLALGALIASACMIGAWAASDANFWATSPFNSVATSQSSNDFGVVARVHRVRLRSQEVDPGAVAATRGETILLLLLTLGNRS